MQTKNLILSLVITTLVLTFTLPTNALENDVSISLITRNSEGETDFLTEIDGYSYMENLPENLELGLEYNLEQYTGDKGEQYYLKPIFITEERYPALKKSFTGIEVNYKYNQNSEKLLQIIPYLRFEEQLADGLKGNLRAGWRFREGDVSTTELLVEPSFEFKHMFTKEFSFGVEGEADLFKLEDRNSWENSYEVKHYFRQAIQLKEKKLIGEINYTIEKEELSESSNETNVKVGLEF